MIKLIRAFRLFERNFKNKRIDLAIVFSGWRATMGNKESRNYIKSFLNK